ncbi:MAG TPA: ABC transporter substrate-binding protein [Tepidisphaeraceae bacterium]|jgi:peptide/nickel transport system substrate-binding protein
MENRFGVKDFVLFVVLGGIVVLIVLAMLQFDRQWDSVQEIKHKLDQQAVDLQVMQQQISRGVTPASTQTTANSTVAPSEKRILAAKAMPDYSDGDWMINGQSARFATLTPLVSGDASASEVQSYVIESLLTRDPVTLEFQGVLAESWAIKDNSIEWRAYAEKRRAVPLTPDEVLAEKDCPPADKAAERDAYLKERLAEGRTDDNIGAEPDCPPAAIVTFKLRDNAKFSDGKPVTADDLVFSYDFIMNPAIDAPRQRAYFARMRSVKKLGPREVEIVFNTPYFEALGLAGGLEVMPKHFYGKFAPEEFNRSTGLLMGSGPYMPETPEGWKPGNQVRLIRNPRYWATPSALSRFVYREFTNQVALETAFRNGEIDQFGAPPETYVAMKRDPKIAERTHQYEYQSAIGGYRYIAWNQQRGGAPTKFADKRVRQAMTLLIDQQRLINEVMLGFAVPATGPFNPQSKQVDPSVKPYPYDVERALKLLAEAGWSDRGDGTLTNEQGQPFELTLTYRSGSPNYEKMALLVKDMLARGKVRVIANAQEWSIFTTKLKNKDFDAITLGWTAGIETDIFQMFHSSQMIAGGDDFMSYKNAELDRTIAQARLTLDEDARLKLWQQAHRILHEDQPYTFLFFPKSLVLMDKRFANVQTVPLGLNSEREWFVPRAQQRWTN